ncbi:hypothetical protein [Nonomuraea jabiensis]|uniref:Uncharacterized protein n=1 Tax=Nonomuraea jabiensis TaxID=882448 RepID=A0A7W9LHH7_9ACTN|nr:hypothetical protein [Nonomuraea jabiensis]MBB5783987.1 hypothetical protein [Nonomuraea jabiensis]
MLVFKPVLGPWVVPVFKPVLGPWVVPVFKPIFYGCARWAARADVGDRLSWPVVKAHGLLAVTTRILGRLRGRLGRDANGLVRCVGLLVV